MEIIDIYGLIYIKQIIGIVAIVIITALYLTFVIICIKENRRL
jgi:hypothetical protein|nr:MAG TPA: hypothetical protein [Caudoviricetes sp.]